MKMDKNVYIIGYLSLFFLSCGQSGLSEPKVIYDGCRVSKNNRLTTITCPDGSTSNILDGQDGINGVGNTGPQGLPGPIGLPGSNGTPGTTITPIKFCAETPTYPSVFPEYGLIIDGKLYAVYSTHGGFLTYIMPGHYSSNAVGSTCSFTVNSNGTVTRD